MRPVSEENEFLQRREFNSSLDRKSEKVIDPGIEVGLIEQVDGKWICALVSHEINAIDSAG
jgi:hypothetical protein